MKRFFFSVFFLFVGVALGGGGLYLALNYKQLPYFRDKREVAAKSLLSKIRSVCATDAELRGAFIKSAEIEEGKLTLRGFAANKEQVAKLHAMGQSILDINPDLKSQCENGLALDGLTVASLLDRLPVWQREFEESKGAEKDTPDNAKKREVMRTTRLDDIEFSEDGKLVISGICIRGNRKQDATTAVLGDLLSDRIVAAGVSPELMPDVALNFEFRQNPATSLQNKLANVPEAKGAYIVSAHYDAKGKLNLAVILAQEEQLKLVHEALNTLWADPQNLAMLAAPGKDGATDFGLREITVGGEMRTRELQKDLAEHARKADKPFLRKVLLANVVPAVITDEKKEPITDEEGNQRFVFRVTGKVLASVPERKEIESSLAEWLADALPKTRNPNQTPIQPQLDVISRESPVLALQERAVQRGLDGTAFTDAIFDADGKLQIVGRLAEPGDDAKQTLETAVKDLLDADAPWSLAVKPHDASKGGNAIAWNDVVRACRAILASDPGLGRRVRLDRLFFDYRNGQLKLAAKGAFLDAGADHPGAVLVRSIDAVILSREKSAIAIDDLRAIKNPLGELQDLLIPRADLDGVFLTSLRFDADGRLQLDGFVGQAEHKNAVAAILNERLAGIPGLLAKTEPAWSLDGMKPHSSTKGAWKWPDVMRVCQSELAASPEAPLQRMFLERAYFQYGKTGRPALRCKTINLLKPNEKLDQPALTKKLDALAKRLLPDTAFDQTALDMHQAATPIYDLQKLAQERKFDGLLFAEAFYDHEGKLKFDGLRGGDTKDVKLMIEQHLAKDKKPIAPAGLAGLDKMKSSPWQAMLDDTRGNLAGDAQALLKQTRIDRAYFEHDHFGNKTRIRFEGICIHQGKTPMPEQTKTLTELFTKHLLAKGIAGYEIAIDTVEKKTNPAPALQKKAIELGLDGVVFNQIGFDAKGVCYVKLPLVPKGQEANIRKLLDDAAKTHPYLGAIQQR